MREQLKFYLKDWAGIEELVRLGLEESSDLDFKREPYAHPKKSPEKKREDQLELRRDVVSFANASGGTIILGIAENDLGQAAQIVGVEDVRASENFVTEVLSRDVAPAFENGALRVRVLRKSEEPILAVILIEVDQCQPGHPRAVINNGLAEFWIREGKSKRPMTYAQIEQDFHGDEEAQEQRHIDAQAKSAVLRVQHHLEKERGDWEEVRPLLEQLREYADEFRYGPTVKEAVFSAACIPLEFARARIPYDVAELAIDLIRHVLPIYSLVGSAANPLEDRELELLGRAASEAVDLIYDATRRLSDIIVINTGAKLLHNILRFAHINKLLEFKNKIMTEFEERISWAENDKIKGGGALLRYYRDDALTLPREGFVEYPDGLEWLIWKSPDKFPKDYSSEE